MKKKFLAILLATLMVMTLLPTVAFADGKTAVTNVTADTNFEGLYGKTLRKVKDRLVTNVSDGVNDLEIDALYFIRTSFGDLNITFLTDDDVITPGGYSVIAVVKAEEGTYFTSKQSTLIPKSLELGDDFTSSAPFTKLSLNGEVNHAGSVDTSFTSSDDEEQQQIDFEAKKENVIYCGLLYTVDVDAPSAEIKGTITAEDFAYEMVIPADTTLTEDDHTNKLLGTDGKVSIEVTKHGANNVNVSYTVDLANGNLTDGTTTIDATYKYKQGEAGFAEIIDDGEEDATKVTVYTGGKVVDSYVNVTAADSGDHSWAKAPVGEYIATVVFEFDLEVIPTVPLSEIFPDDLRLSVFNPMEGALDLSQCFADEGKSYLAGVVEPESQFSSIMTMLTNGNDCANQFIVLNFKSDSPMIYSIPLTAAVMDIEDGYQYIGHSDTYGAPDTGDVVTVFTMESNKLTKITVTLYIENVQKVIEMTPSAED